MATPDTGSTATTGAARAHARAQEGTRAEAMPYRPASTWPSPPPGVPAEDLTWAETVAAGGYTHKILARGTSLRLADPAGDACVHVLLYDPDHPVERLNVADTVKVPWQAYVTTGHPLLSDQGRAMATVLEDTSTRHDALCGTSSLARNTERYGDGTAYGPAPAGRELLRLAAAKYGLTARDVPPSLSFFQGVRVAEDGTCDFTGSAGPGTHVTLRAERPLLVLVANVPHPLDPRPEYTGSTLEVLAWPGEPTRPGDELWDRTPEVRRALTNTADHLAARGIK